ncbi:MAG: hypothetical protein ABIH40_03310 [Candidatus Omnitrophota bacterium]
MEKIKKRPRGVTIIGNLNKWLFGVAGFILAIFALLSSLSPSPQMVEKLAESGRTLSQSRIQWSQSMIFCIISFIIGNGLLHLKSWGRNAAIYYFIFTSALSLQNSITTHLNWGGTLFSLVITIVIIYYLFRPEVKKLFVYKGLDGINWF